MDSTVIVFSDVVVQLTRGGKPLEPGDVAQIATLGEQGIALVLCSDQTASEVKHIQNMLGLSQPIICDGGETVVVPRGCGAPGDRYRREERIIRCRPQHGPREDADTAGARAASCYQRGVAVIVGLFGGEAPVFTLGVTDPTRPNNLLPLVDQTIFVGAEDARGALEVADWVAAIADAADQLRSARRRSTAAAHPWRTTPQPQFSYSFGGQRLSPGGARPN
jgi:hypothetical protein